MKRYKERWRFVFCSLDRWNVERRFLTNLHYDLTYDFSCYSIDREVYTILWTIWRIMNSMECGEITMEREGFFFFFFLWIDGIWKDDFQCRFSRYRFDWWREYTIINISLENYIKCIYYFINSISISNLYTRLYINSK